MNITLLLIFVLGLGVSVVLFPLARKLAFSLKIVDKPDERKIHTKVIPYLGSVMIFGGFMVAMLVYAFVFDGIHSINKNILLGIGISAGAMHILGLIDDKYNIPAWWKLAAQSIVALIPALFGLYIDKITNPFGGSIILPLPVAFAITVFWLVALANAVNLIDGMDGLCAGVMSVAIVFLMLILSAVGSPLVYPLAALLGSLLGYLIFNFPPAKIFMGDSGSLFIGFIIGAFSLLSDIKSSFAITLVLPIVLLLIPIIDTFLAVIRRIKNKQHVFGADKKHLHHRLLDLGHSPGRVLLIMYGISALLGSLSLAVFFLDLSKEITLILLFVLAENVVFAIFLLNLFEKRRDDMLRFENHIQNYSILTESEKRRFAIEKRRIEEEKRRLLKEKKYVENEKEAVAAEKEAIKIEREAIEIEKRIIEEKKVDMEETGGR